MHTIVIHNEALRRWPEAPKILYDLYVEAKQRALKRRLGTTFVPWLDREWDQALDLFGGDSHPYGLGPANRHTIETLCRYLHEQRLIGAPVDVDSLFAEGSTGWLPG